MCVCACTRETIPERERGANGLIERGGGVVAMGSNPVDIF